MVVRNRYSAIKASDAFRVAQSLEACVLVDRRASARRSVCGHDRADDGTG
jgi:hypothetical protein